MTLKKRSYNVTDSSQVLITYSDNYVDMVVEVSHHLVSPVLLVNIVKEMLFQVLWEYPHHYH